MYFPNCASSLQRINRGGSPSLLVLLFLMTIMSLAVVGSTFGATGQKMVVPPTAHVSWSELVSMEETKAPPADQVPREIPFMHEPPPGRLEETDDRSAPPDALFSPYNLVGSIPPATTNFQALPDNNTTIPPDTHGAVGRDYVMTMLNSQVRIQTRTGANVSTVSLATFWAPAGGSGEFDPHLIYDQSEDRWMAICDSDRRSAASSVLFAISDSDDPTGSWTFYNIDADPTNIDWADFPDIGFNNTWIAITNNMFTVSSDSYSGNAMWVIDKSTALAGGALTLTFFPVGSDVFGGYGGSTLRVCQTFGSEPKLYLVDRRWKIGATHVLRLTEITGTASSPTWSATPGSISGYPGTGWFYVINNFDWNQINASQLGTSVLVETNDPRILNAVYRNGKVWCTHSGGLPIGAVDRTAVFWYELDPTAMPTPIVQSGVLDGGSDVHHFFPSITANANGDALIGFSRSDASRYVEGVYTGRLASDPLGTMDTISVLKVGEDSYVKVGGSGRVRWGDFSATVVDPVDDFSFWTIQEYAAQDVGPGASDDRWGTWWGKVAMVAQLEVLEVTVSRDTVNWGEVDIAVDVVVENSGGTDAWVDSTDLRFRQGTTNLDGEYSVDLLNPIGSLSRLTRDTLNFSVDVDSPATPGWVVIHSRIFGRDVNIDMATSDTTGTQTDSWFSQGPADLVCSLWALPDTVSTGQSIYVHMEVRNTGWEYADSVVPGVNTLGTGSVIMDSGPVPPHANIGPGDGSTFSWACTGENTHWVYWEGWASGRNRGNQHVVTSPSDTSNQVFIQTRAQLEVLAVIATVDTVNWGDQNIPVDVVIENMGEADAVIDSTNLRFCQNAANLDNEYTLSLFNPISTLPGSIADTLNFSIDVDSPATGGWITTHSRIFGRDVNSGASTFDTTAAEPDSFYVFGYACGDCNGDGFVNFADALYVKNFYYQTPPGSPAPIGQGDVNLDTFVNFADALYIKNYYYQTPSGSPPPCEPTVTAPFRGRRMER